MSKSWLYDSSNSNIFKQSYMKDFLDVSGDIYIRNGNLIATNDISMNGNVSCNDISLTVPFSSSGINSDVSGALALKQKKISFVGRLATYRYIDMDVTIRDALDAAKIIIDSLSKNYTTPVFFTDIL